MKIVTASQMRDLDLRTIAAGTPGSILMERAGSGAATHILDFISRLDPVQVRRFVLLAGKGNNGGDAYVCARLLRQMTPHKITVYSVCELSSLQGDADRNAGKLPDGIEVIVKKQLAPADFHPGDIIIDGMLGTGINGKLKPPYDQWIPVVNQTCLPVISLDIPSGLNGDDGSVASAAIKADMTVIIGLPKTGLTIGAGPELCGILRLVDIGILPDLTAKDLDDVDMPFNADIAPRLGRIAPQVHKNSRGRLLIAGGSGKYCGAPFLCAAAAARTGAGYIRLALPRSVDIHVAPWPSLVLNRLADDKMGSFSDESIPAMGELLNRSDAMVIGPGLGNARSLVKFMNYISTCKLPIVFDADALNMIAEVPELYLGKDSNILTPHPGEMKRLLSAFSLDEYQDQDRTNQARALADATDSTIVLKGHRTIVCSPDGRLSINSTGTPALAKAGTGDSLSGMIDTFAAQGFDPFEAAETAVYIHGLAGELSPYGMRGLRPEDLIDLIPVAMKHISPFA